MNSSESTDSHDGHGRQPLAVLMLGALGVVYGDIGTSPLYAMKETFGGPHPLALDELHVLGVLSLIFWAVMIVVSVKYASLIMRADNRGEGGSLALLALVSRVTEGSRMAFPLMVLGLFAASLFYGDSMITPAISVLSAVEGLQVASPALADFVIPITLVILVGLFVIQSKGTGAVGVLFGPVMALWFGSLAVMGAVSVAQHPGVLWSLNPVWAVRFFMADGWLAFLALGSVVLAVTGAEALYTDMGHFGRKPIRVAWFWFVMPALMLNYMGQGALLLRQPEAVENPFYLLAPEHLQLALVGLATLATIIASQAVISGAFTVTLQAIQLGFLPRMRIRYTSAREKGQIYLPFINWSLLAFVVALVLGFRSSSNLASAYGIAVTGTMLIDSLLIAVVMFMLWKWDRFWAGLALVVFLCVDVAFFAANSTKIAHGGWFPLAVGVAIFTMLVTWKRGRALLAARIREDSMPLDTFIETSAGFVDRVPGTAVFLTGATVGTPHALLHNLKHNKVLHERVVLLTVQTAEIPFVAERDRVTIEPLDHNFYRVVAHYGFMDDPDVPAVLASCAKHGLEVDMMETSFFLSRETLIPSVAPGMALWREKIFAWMSRNAQSPMDFFKLPVNRVVELGTQIEI